MPQRISNQRIVGHCEDQPGAAHAGGADARRDRRRIEFGDKGAVDRNRPVQRRSDALESPRQPGEERRLRPYQNDLDADDAAMCLRQPARIVERARGGDHFLHDLGPDAAAAVQHTLDRGCADASVASDVGESRLGDGGLNGLI